MQANTTTATPLDAEWLEVDGLSGFACGTVAMRPARRYHGLLVAPLPGTATRHVFLGFCDERVGDLDLAPRAHADAPPPNAVADLDFELAPWPRTTLGDGSTLVSREVLMPRGRHAVLVRYTNRGDAAIELRLRPRLPMREADNLTIKNDVLDETIEALEQGIRCRPYAVLPALTLRWDHGTFTPGSHWDRGIELAMELVRGFGGHEDQWSPGELRVELAPGADVILGATIDDAPLDVRATWDRETTRRTVAASESLFDRLDSTAADFLFEQPVGDGSRTRTGILAGFPWFVEWGRDTFLALPGLTLARGRVAQCGEILRGVVPFVVDGLVPNIFGAGIADSHYGSVDAALWFARATLLYDRAGGDAQVLERDLYPVLREIADHYAAGTAPRIQKLGIGTDAEGMVFAGTPELNPTWMDAKPYTGAVTPRHGCPVEIAALWYSLHAWLAELAERFGDLATAGRYGDQAQRIGNAFLERFWLEADGYLADVWRPDAVDRSVRPNMVFAASLELSPLSDAQRAAVVDRVERDLLTPVGLRTLAPSDPEYLGRYTGGPLERDSAYHQGTVWPWLLGMFVEAALRVDDSAARRQELRSGLERLRPELDRCGLAHLSEVFDGDAPHTPGGTFAQAWNSGEILRALAMLGPSR